jgi:inosose dehydratase
MVRIANAPCSWGVLEFGLEGESAGYAQVLDEISAAGYCGTELGDWGFLPTEPDVLESELQKRQLAMVGAFVPVDFSNPECHETGVQAALCRARLLAAVSETAFIILADENGKDPVRTGHAGRIRSEEGLSPEAWAIFAGGVETVARAVREQTGLRCAFHHHCAGYVETPDEVEQLLSLTDPDLVGLCFDTGHYHFGGGDALEGLRKYAHRIWHMHFKDHDPATAARSRREGWDYFDAVRSGVFCELGKGDVQFPAVLEELRAMGYAGWVVVEQDVLPGMGSPMESALRNRAYLRDLGV